MIVLGIETSCDETAAALVGADKTVIASRTLSQLKEHKQFGGVVPEIAARAHLQYLPALIREVMAEADIAYTDLAGVAATTGPGLIGGLIVGSTLAKALAFTNGVPFYAINHLEGHALSPRLCREIDFPYLLLLVSGGHTQFVKINGVANYQLLGTTMDDAAGEAFDKVAKILNLPYPGGPQIEKIAALGKAERFDFPVPLKGRAGCDFSFSGLKTSVKQTVDKLEVLEDKARADVAAGFQRAVVAVIADRTRHALEMAGPVSALVVAGGVAANQAIRTCIEEIAKENNLECIAPPLKLCTDNAEMIAWAAIERLQQGLPADAFDAKPRPRWPLEMLNVA